MLGSLKASDKFYADNIGTIGLDPGFTGSTQDELVSRFNAAVLRVHEVERHKSFAELFGVRLDLEQHLGIQGIATPKFVQL